MNSLKFQDRLLGLQDNLLNFAYMLTANREEAKDLLQDTTLKALDNEDKYIDNVNLFYSPLPVCISTSVFESFSAEDQQLLRDAAVEAGLAARSNNDATAESMEADLASQGMTIISEEEVDTEAFRTAVAPCYEQMEFYIGSEWVNELKALVGMA